MQDLIRKVGRFVENHVEKIVLVIVGVVCAALFFRSVIFSPNVVQVGDKGLSPGRIDTVILEQARELERNINTTTVTQPAPAYPSVLTGRIDANHPAIAGILNEPLPKGFMGLFASPLESLGGRPTVVQPGRMVAGSVRKYKLPPEIGRVTDVGINHIRAAAWVPLQEVTPEDGYDKVAVDAGDIDLVTVEAKFEVAELYRQFKSHFDGVDVPKPEWRDPCLAEPVFAAVQLQRSVLQEDGAWSDWQEVPRSRVEANKELFQAIERVQDLPPGGMQVRLMQFKRKPITMSLLQPEAYQIASAEEDWFPPSFYGKFKTLQKKVELEEKREERESSRDQQERTDGRYREGRMGGVTGGQATGTGGRYRSSTSGTAGGDAMSGTRGGRLRGAQTQQDPAYGGAYGDQAGRTRGTSTRGRGRPQDEAALYGDMAYGQGVDPRKPSTNEVYMDLIGKMITYRTDLSRVEEPLLFWAFDDTAEPGGAYRYRVRLGVFNPVAGTDQVVEQDAGRKDQVILWSNFSPVTAPVEIPRRLYFFAKDVQMQETKRSATVEVARYLLGYWRSEDFEVRPGEVIGREMKPKVEEKKRTSPLSSRITDPAYAGATPPVLGLGVTPTGPFGASPTANLAIPRVIDYRTGHVLVDLVQVNDWGEPPTLRPRMYHEMLYTSDGTKIEHMPAGATHWPRSLASAYQYVKAETRREPQPFRDFKKGGIRSRMQPGMMGYEGMEGMMYDESMYMDMGGAGPYR